MSSASTTNRQQLKIWLLNAFCLYISYMKLLSFVIVLDQIDVFCYLCSIYVMLFKLSTMSTTPMVNSNIQSSENRLYAFC